MFNVGIFYKIFLNVIMIAVVSDAAKRFFQTKYDERHLKENGKYDAKVLQQRRRNCVNRMGIVAYSTFAVEKVSRLHQ